MTVDVVSSIASFLGLAMGGTAFVRVFFAKKPTFLQAKKAEGKLVKILYVISDIRGRSHSECHDAIAKAQQQYVNLLRLGIYPMAVGVNTPYQMRDYAIPELFEESGKELAKRADGVLLMVGYESSPEAQAVLAYARAHDKPVFEQTEGYLSDKLRAWAVKEE